MLVQFEILRPGRRIGVAPQQIDLDPDGQVVGIEILDHAQAVIQVSGFDVRSVEIPIRRMRIEGRWQRQLVGRIPPGRQLVTRQVDRGHGDVFLVRGRRFGVTTGDIEMAIGEMCNTVKNTYGDDKGGFIGGQVFEYTGFVSPEGSFDPERKTEDHIVIITYWNSFEQHEKSHADSVFKEKFEALAEHCSETYELGYEMLWQGVPEE